MVNYPKVLYTYLRHQRNKFNTPNPHLNHPTIVVSFPKCGRTWLRFIFAELDLPFRIGFSHAKSDLKNWIHCKTFYKKKEVFEQEKKLILLIREPKDIVVSYYFHISHRDKIFSGSFMEFIKNEYLGIKKIMSFYEACIFYTKQYNQILIVEYENLVKDTYSEVSRILAFLEVEKDSEKIKAAIEATRFNNLQKRERENFFKETTKNKNLTPTKIHDINSYKVRRGKIGGYIDYLSVEEIKYCDDVIRDSLNAFYPKK